MTYDEWTLVGHVEVLKLRIYPLDPYGEPSPLKTTAAVEPGNYPVYRKYDAYLWILRGRLNQRNVKIGDGLFELNSGDVPTGLPVEFPSQSYGAEQFADFLKDPICQPGSQQRLRFTIKETV